MNIEIYFGFFFSSGWVYYGYVLVYDFSDMERPRLRGNYTKVVEPQYNTTYYSRALKVVGAHLYYGDTVYCLKDFRIERKDKP